MRALKRVKWLNVLKIVGFIGCLTLIVHDLFMVTVYGWITSNMVGWTWFGFATFVAAIMTAGTIFDDLEEQWNAIETKKRESLGKTSQMEYFVKYSLHYYSKKWSSSQRWW